MKVRPAPSHCRTHTRSVRPWIVALLIACLVLCLSGCARGVPVATDVAPFERPTAAPSPTGLPTRAARLYPTLRLWAPRVPSAYPLPPTVVAPTPVEYPLPAEPKGETAPPTVSVATETATKAVSIAPPPTQTQPVQTPTEGVSLTATLSATVSAKAPCPAGGATPCAGASTCSKSKPSGTASPCGAVSTGTASVSPPSATATLAQPEPTLTVVLPAATPLAGATGYPVPESKAAAEDSSIAVAPAYPLPAYPLPAYPLPATATGVPTPKSRRPPPPPDAPAVESAPLPPGTPTLVPAPSTKGETTPDTAFAPHVESGVSALQAPPACTTPVVVDERLVAAINGFGFDLLAQVMGEDLDSSTLVAPLGTHVLLTMLYNGAMGETRQEMRAALGLREMSMRSVNEGYADLLQDMEAPGRGIEVTALNALLFDDDAEYDDEYLARMGGIYRAVAKAYDLADPDLSDEVNEWVEAQTHGLVPAVLDAPAEPESLLLLLNALHVGGAWRYGFAPEQSASRPFERAPGEIVDVPMMTGVLRELAYYSEPERLALVRLPFTDERISMLILLPSRQGGVSVQSLLGGLDAEVWSAWSSAMSPQYVTVQIPRLEIDASHRLGGALGALGIESAFSADDADLGAYAPAASELLWIQDVHQRVVLALGPDGVEPGVPPGHSGARSVIPFVADRPFFFVVRDDVTGVILLMGVYAGPQAE